MKKLNISYNGKKIDTSLFISLVSEITKQLNVTKSEYGYIYVIKHARGYKIGASSNPKTRLQILRSYTAQKAETIACVPVLNHEQVEIDLHNQFKAVMIGESEWFNLSSDDVDLIIERLNTLKIDIDEIESALSPEVYINVLTSSSVRVKEDKTLKKKQLEDSELYSKAIDLLNTGVVITTSLLQTKLGIGYPRAKRLYLRLKDDYNITRSPRGSYNHQLPVPGEGVNDEKYNKTGG